MKASCMAIEVEGGKQVIREQIVTGKFVPGEPSTLLEHTQAMHAEVKPFLETDFASYLHLGELDIKGLHQLCIDSDAKGKHLEAKTYRAQPSSTPPGMLLLSSSQLFVLFEALFRFARCL
ncbi:unnamed protein product [Lactuca virosa]|uniref:Uncharacterized protein n=1 Tax=Lactuca virosa TaxID=75947 RepID=A0AAU9P8D8_9ASTR|nr:unnamed protein product [Lactuca virosa]